MLAALWTLSVRPRKKENHRLLPAGENSWTVDLLLVFFLAAAVLLRFYKLGAVPYGLQQDEASIGYEAWSLLHYGIDRYGNPWPVYPITFGSGGGSPLMVYLTMLPTAILGTGPLTVRVLPALFGALTVLMLSSLTGLSDGKRMALITAAVTALCPWHVIFSRWALDSNTVPFWESLMLLLLFAGVVHKKKLLLFLGAAAGALCLYAYGTTTFVVPAFLLLFAVYLLCTRKVSLMQVVFCVAAFLIVSIPLLFFYAYNYLGMEHLQLPFFSMQKLLVFRKTFYPFDSALPGKMLENLKYLAIFLTVGMEKGELASTVLPGYAQMYRFTFPFFLTGLFAALSHACGRNKRKKQTTAQRAEEERSRIAEVMMLLLFVCIFLFSLFIEPNVNRMIMFLIPMAFFQAKGWELFLTRIGNSGGIARAAGTVLCAGCVLLFLAAGLWFARDYFGDDYARQTEEYFMPGYSEAVVRATEIAEEEDKEVLSTYERLSSPFMLAMYAAKEPPEEVLQTAQYRLAAGEFYVADRFGRYTFGIDELPADLKNTVLILYKDEEAQHQYPEEEYEKEAFGNYVVVSERLP